MKVVLRLYYKILNVFQFRVMGIRGINWRVYLSEAGDINRLYEGLVPRLQITVIRSG